MTFDRQLIGNARRREALGAAAGALALTLVSSCSAAWAQAPGGFSSLGNGADAKQPIDINSDRLEVDDKKHMAVFIGNVSATQGTNNLKAPRLEVFYENSGQSQAADKGEQTSNMAKPVNAAATNASVLGDPASNGQIKRIHATGGRVVVTNARDQQEATGDDAEYDVTAQKITMKGKKVLLKNGTSILEGTKLEINLKTGITNFDSAARISAVFKPQAGQDGKLIIPGQPQKAAPSQPARKPAPPKQDPAPGQGWQPQNQ